MNFNDKIYVAGHTGLVGTALVKRLRALGYNNLLIRTRQQVDLVDAAQVAEFFAVERPKYVFLAAAKVGGILANSKFPADFIFENLSIELNVIRESWRNGVDRLLFLGSSCIYPRMASQPIHEDSLLSGALELTNRPYAVAKIAGIEMCWALNKQHGTSFLAVMPTNLYGPGDNYDLDGSHVIPALIRKMHEATGEGRNTVAIWGTGNPRREFLYSEDLADACVFLMNLRSDSFAQELSHDENAPPVINIGCGVDSTIREIAEGIAEVVEFSGQLVFQPDKPDGTPRKLLDTSRLNALGWHPQTDFREGLRQTYRDFCLRARHVSAISTASD